LVLELGYAVLFNNIEMLLAWFREGKIACRFNTSTAYIGENQKFIGV
jgi:hypothetical protein